MDIETLQIEICPVEPRASLGMDLDRADELADYLLYCTGPGDAEPACKYVVDTWPITIRIWDAGLGDMRKATESEVRETLESIYFDSESDFSDESTARVYLVWEVAHSYRMELEYQESE